MIGAVFLDGRGTAPTSAEECNEAFCQRSANPLLLDSCAPKPHAVREQSPARAGRAGGELRGPIRGGCGVHRGEQAVSEEFSRSADRHIAASDKTVEALLKAASKAANALPRSRTVSA